MSAAAPTVPEAAPRQHRQPRRWLRWLLVVGAVLAILLGTGLGAGAIFYGQVTLPDSITLPERTTVFYSDGKTVMFRLGDQNRHILSADQINDPAKQATVAALDPDFYGDSGSPISRALIRALDPSRAGSGVTDRAKVYVASRKLEAKYSKDDILGMYLNQIGFGRGAFGIEAAAQVYFGRTVNRSAPAPQQVDLAHAIALAAMIGQPQPDPLAGSGAADAAHAAFDRIRQSMVGAGFVSQVQADALNYPTDIIPVGSTVDESVQPTALIVQHVLSELRQSPQFQNKPKGYIENGGFDIITTIDKRAQAAVENAANPAVKGSVVAAQPKSVAAAAVMVQPGTGRVLAYFGNRDGGGADYAGWYYDADGVAVGYGEHPAGPDFAVYALVTALKQRISLDSAWDSLTVKDFPEAGRSAATGNPVVDPNRAPCQPRCTLTQAARASLTVPFFDLTMHLGAANVLATARDLGIDYMWTNQGKRRDLRTADIPNSEVPNFFDTVLGNGQYPITVMDQANAMASLAAGGRRATAHFVMSVRQDGNVIYGENLDIVKNAGLTPGQLGDLDAALSGTSLGEIKGIESASMVGTARIDPADPRPGHAWTIGYSNSLALAVWVGDAAGHTIDIPNPVDVPAAIYRAAMTSAYQSMALKPAPFPKPGHTGQLHPAGSI